MFNSLSAPRASRTDARKVSTARFSGVAAGPAERGAASTTSTTYLADIGSSFDVVARVAGTTPQRAGDAVNLVRHCLRTVDDGLALCCPLPDTEHLRLGSVVRVRGTVTNQRTQGSNHVTEIAAEAFDRIG